MNSDTGTELKVNQIIQEIKKKENELRECLFHLLRSSRGENPARDRDVYIELQGKHAAILSLMDNIGMLNWNKYLFRISLPEYGTVDTILTIPEVFTSDDVALIIKKEHNMLKNRSLYSVPEDPTPLRLRKVRMGV